MFKNLVNNDKNIKYICSEFTKNSDIPKIIVNVDPNNFINNKINPLNHTNNKWFINLTNAIISTQVSNVLQLGGNFSLPIDSNKKTTIHEFVKDIENHNRYINDTEKAKICNTIIPFFQIN